MRVLTWLVLCVLLMMPGVSGAQVVISEIMYNPDSNEGYPPDPNDPDDPGKLNAVEWVELYNPGDTAVDIAGWTLVDEDGTTGPIAEGASIGPGAVVVIASTQTSASAFHAAWGAGYSVYTVEGWGDDGLYNLSNAPNSDNEILRIVDAEGTAIDTVNYDDEGDWPSDRPDGSSIYLPPDVIDAEKNDEGFNWRLSEPGVHGAKNNKPSAPFNGIDAGSPGTVDTTDTADSAEE
jgi:lamin tail-like protein